MGKPTRQDRGNICAGGTITSGRSILPGRRSRRTAARAETPFPRERQSWRKWRSPAPADHSEAGLRRGGRDFRRPPGGGTSGGGGGGPAKMLRWVWRWLSLALALALCGPAGAPSPGDPAEGTRPYAVLRGQNLGERVQAAGGSEPGPRCREGARGFPSGAPALCLHALLFIHLFFWLWGHPQQHSGLPPWPCTQNHSWQALGTPLGCQESNPGSS